MQSLRNNVSRRMIRSPRRKTRDQILLIILILVVEDDGGDGEDTLGPSYQPPSPVAAKEKTYRNTCRVLQTSHSRSSNFSISPLR